MEFKGDIITCYRANRKHDDDDDDEEHVDVGDDVGGGVGTYWAGWQKLAAFRRGEKMSIKIFVKRAFTIIATDASFLRVIATFQI